MRKFLIRILFVLFRFALIITGLYWFDASSGVHGKYFLSTHYSRVRLNGFKIGKPYFLIQTSSLENGLKLRYSSKLN